MIAAAEVLEVVRARLSDGELAAIQRLVAEVAAAVRAEIANPEFDGTLPFRIQLNLTDVPESMSLRRVLHGTRRHFQASGWDAQISVGASDNGTSPAIELWLEIRGRAPEPPQRKLAVPAHVAQTQSRPVLETLREELLAIQRIGAAAVRPIAAQPALSIIFGTYNRIALLRQAIDSVRQSVGALPYEIVVCDGGSSDGSREWLSAQPDVILIGERRLEGAVKAFNQCYAATRGEFIANLNDDCTVEGSALEGAVRYLREHPQTGQVAFSFRGQDEDWHINDIYPSERYSSVTWPTTYANFGIIRRSVADVVVAIQGGFWSPVYRTYAADCELSAWTWRLGHRVDKLPHLRVVDVRNEDALRAKNTPDSGLEAKRMYARWPAEAFQPGGPEPRVSAEELDRLHRALAGTLLPPPAPPPDMVEVVAGMVGFPEPQEERRLRALAPRLRALDPVDTFPARAERLPEGERVLHVSLCTDADPQAGLVRALRGLGSGGYAEVRWFADYGNDPDRRRRAILDAAASLRPTIVVMQLQAPNAVDVETVREIRRLADPSCVILTWNGDIADVNNPWSVDWQVPLARTVDIALHSSMSHVRTLRAAGAHCAAYLQIGYDPEQYRAHVQSGDDILPMIMNDFDVSFLGSRYGADAFSQSMRRHDAALRDEVVIAMKQTFGDRFGLFGRGWADIMRQRGIDHADQIIPLDRAHEAYWRSKIGLNVSLANFLDFYSSDRLFRILGCGSLLLTKRFPGMPVLGLKHGENCLVWDTAEEAVQFAQAYIARGSEKIWKDCAAAGAELARNHHTWDVRMLELMPYLAAVRGQ